MNQVPSPRCSPQFPGCRRMQTLNSCLELQPVLVRCFSILSIHCLSKSDPDQTAGCLMMLLIFFQNHRCLRLSESDFFIWFPVFVLNIAIHHKQTNKNGHPGHPFRELYDIAEAKDVRELHEVQAELEISEDSAQETTSI